MEAQADGMSEIFGTEEQLKELYDSMESEDKAKEEEFKKLKDEMNQITAYLDSCGIPSKDGGKTLSVLERLYLINKKVA